MEVHFIAVICHFKFLQFNNKETCGVTDEGLLDFVYMLGIYSTHINPFTHDVRSNTATLIQPMSSGNVTHLTYLSVEELGTFIKLLQIKHALKSDSK